MYRKLEEWLKFDKSSGLKEKLAAEEQLKRQVTTLFGLLSNLYSPDKLVLKTAKLEAIELMKSEDLPERVLALQRIIYEDPTIEPVPSMEEIPGIIADLEEEIANYIARRTVEEELEKKINQKMQERHEDYVKEIKLQVLKETTGPENAHTLKKYALLEKQEQVKLSQSAIEMFRPEQLDEIVGQERAVRALLVKIASPYPQHVILYGPPGVGKTTAARLVLQQAKQLHYTPFKQDAKFVEVDGTTLRWDPREVTNPLLGSVHDPIYQGARRDLADSGIPEPKPGLVTEANGGVLFIDEIGELDLMLQNKLLKVLEDKRVSFDSSYYDPADPNIPKYIKKLFEEGAPADFVLIGATTRDPSEINPAIRSRCAEVYFEPLAPQDIRQIVIQAAQKIGIVLADGVTELISEYTIEGRKAIGILADAYGIALYKRETPPAKDEPVHVTAEDVTEALQTGRMSPYVFQKASATQEVGRIFGLGVAGFLGSALEIEAVAFPAGEKGKGRVRFNETAGSMAKDSVFNAASVIRQMTGEDPGNYDLHVNVIGGGKIDGPSAGVAVMLAMASAITKKPIPQDIAVTGELSIQGRVKAVGGIYEKIYGAKQAGIKQVLIPRENAKDVPYDLSGIEVTLMSTVEEVWQKVFGN